MGFAEKLRRLAVALAFLNNISPMGEYKLLDGTVLDL